MSSGILENNATGLEAASIGSLEDDPIKPMRAFDLKVSAVTQLSEHFRRITFTGTDLALFGSNAEGQTLDLRVKVMIPAPGHALPELSNIRGSLQDDWYQSWLAVDESVRGVMRTYTARALRPAVPAHGDQPAIAAEMDIDFVLHLHGGSGPAAEWAAAAIPGDSLMLVGPCARWGDCLGIEFAPGEAERLLLVGDETAVPAIAAILETLPAHVSGHAVLEVPTKGDFLAISSPANMEIRWLARDGMDHGVELSRQVRALIAPAACELGEEPEDVDVDATILWETPVAAAGHGLYAWIAGEAATIRELRRYLVRDVGMDRNAVAFMGYWRKGQALS
ncbi:NADPH-dependent ferric siderophore reductase, contains FAD-binding and SIP domains [Arthrobacter alpinus]|uniref:NADPH-dependent ferric siderophore reductase, contains FAD-binding and SIP domains n=1 Tax=Arthrobacter alpinus TaxID=656366 RepID=A0A1H5MQN6_9MICC|nr:NADPH-dependent ferric siderophore reductase, contains FAD-binding and SIP domains [Arthrobacter alpinus]